MARRRSAEPRGRDRGPVGLARAWIAVVSRPRRFFRTAVAPGEQGPGLTFAMAVVAVEESTRLLLVGEATPAVVGSGGLAAAVTVAVAVFLLTPVVLHLVAGLQTLCLLAAVDHRAGVSETVQLIAYATAPCVLVGVPDPTLRLACAAYGAVLLTVGVSVVHAVDGPRAVLVGALPAAVVFGFGFRGFAAAGAVASRWHLI